MTSTLAELTGQIQSRRELRRELPGPPMRRLLRTSAGASLEDVARVVGVTPQAVALWESGARTPRGENLENYVAVLRELRRAMGE